MISDHSWSNFFLNVSSEATMWAEAKISSQAVITGLALYRSVSQGHCCGYYRTLHALYLFEMGKACAIT